MPERTFKPTCFDPSSRKMCSDPECKRQIAAYHSITEERFWYTVKNDEPLCTYEGDTLARLRDAMENAVCEEKAGVLNDGTIMLDAINAICEYSVPLLRGIFDQAPVKIEVYAGICAISGNEDRPLRVTFGGTVKFYDMSDTYP